MSAGQVQDRSVIRSQVFKAPSRPGSLILSAPHSAHSPKARKRPPAQTSLQDQLSYQAKKT